MDRGKRTVASLLAVVAIASFAMAGGTTIYVDAANCPGPGDGSIGNPFCDIQSGIDRAGAGDEIIVAPGSYVENLTFIPSITVRSSNGPDQTTIDGGRNGSVVSWHSGEGRDAVLDGFTITGGTGEVEVGHIVGGGLRIYSSPTIRNCTVVANEAADRGGGVWCYANDPGVDSAPLLVSCRFVKNHADNSGGGACIDGGGAVFEDCHFDGNTSGDGGGGIFLVNGGLVSISNCSFEGNNATNTGGGIEAFGTSVGGAPPGHHGTLVTIDGCTFSANTAAMGAGIYGGNVSVHDCTFAGNTATNVGGGLRALSGGWVVVVGGSSFCENLPENVAGDFIDEGGNVFSDRCAPPCPADRNGDNVVGVADLLLVLAQWGVCAPVCIADVDGDGLVGINDLLIVLAEWGPCQ